MPDELSALYPVDYDQRQGDELDRWLAQTLRPTPSATPTRQQYEALVDELAPQYGQDPLLVKAMIQAESAWNPAAVSKAGAQGIAQLMPGTARRFGVQNPFDPHQAIPGMLQYLKTLTQEFGDPTLVVAAYNAGEGAVRQYKGVPPYQETMNYVRKVFGGPEGTPYTSKGAGVGPLASQADVQAMRQQIPYVSKRPATPPAVGQPEEAQLLDTAIPTLAEPGMLDMTQEARAAQTYTSRGAGMGPETFPRPQRFNPYMPGQALEPSLEEPTAQRFPVRVMEGTAGTLASVANLPITAGRLLGLSEQEATTIFPQAAGLRNALQEITKSFDPVGQEENIVDRFAQTVGQQVIFFGTGTAVAKGLTGIAEFAPSIARTLGATTAAIQEAGLEAEQTLTALTPILGEQEAAKRANTVFWRNVAVVGLTNKLGIFSEAKLPSVLKLSTAAGMENFQEIAQYDIGRREFWVDARHPLANQLQALGWKRHAQRVYQPFEVSTAAEAGALGAIIGGVGRVVKDAYGREVLSLDAERKIRRGLEILGERTAQLAPQAETAARPQTQDGQERQRLTGIQARVQGMEASQVRDDEGRLIRMYHGTSQVFQQFATGQADPNALYGPGLYFTDNTAIASGYAGSEESTVMPKPREGSRIRVPQPGDLYAGGTISRVEEGPGEQQLTLFFAVPAHANVRPVYLDIKQPFDAETVLDEEEIDAILAHTDAYFGEGAADEVREAVERQSTTQNITGGDLYQMLAHRGTDEREQQLGKANVNELLRELGYDGIVHTGGQITGRQAHKVYIAFSPEQVIPSFELEAHPWFQSVLAYATSQPSAAEMAESGQQPVEGLGVGTNILSGQAGAFRPFRRISPFPAQPSPPPRGVPSLQGGAEGLPVSQFRDEQGRWRIPLAEMPSQELEIQDFVRQQLGIQLEGEELHGELRAIISRKETGMTGLQNNVRGMTLQQMAEKAEELGFTATADKEAFLEALGRSVNMGHLVYSRNATGYISLVQNPTLQGIYQDLVALAETSQERIQEQRRGTRPRPQVHTEGAEMITTGMMDVETIKEMLPGMALSDETASALVQLMGQMTTDVATVARQYVDGGALPGEGSQAEQDFLTGFVLLASVQPQRLGAIAEAGRSLGILNDPLSPINRLLNQLVEMLPKTPGMQSRELAQKFLHLYDSQGPGPAGKFPQQALEPSLGGMLLELYYQGMLSSPKTWIVNEAGNALTSAWALPVRLMSAAYSQTLGSGEVSLMEPAAYAYGLQHAITDAWRMSAKAFKTMEAQFGTDIPGIMEPIGQQKSGASGPMLTAKNLQTLGVPLDPNTPVGKLADFWFNWVGLSLMPPGLPTGGRLSTRVMLSRDEFYKLFNYRGELAALAYRKAAQEQTIDPNVSFADNMARILAQPLPEEMHQAAAQHALVQTLQNELVPGRLGDALSGIQAWSPDVPGFGPFPVGRIILPFLHVATNVPRYALENSPVGFFFKSVRNDIAAGGARGDMAIGKMLMGSLTAGTFALLASSGLLTGRGPEDKDLRAAMVRAGWQPYSLFVPWLGQRGGYIALQRLDPIVGQHASIVADAVEIYHDQRLDWYEKMIIGPIFAMVSNLGSRSYMRGLSDFFDVMSPRSRREFEGESAYEGIRGFVRGVTSSLTPAVWNVAQKTMDPATKLAWDWSDGMRQKTPGWAADMPNYRNKWGDKRLLGWGWGPDWLNWVEGFTNAVNPLQVSMLMNDPLDRVLLRDQIRLAMPMRSIGLPGMRGEVEGEGAAAAFATAESLDPYAAKSIPLKAPQYEKLVALSSLNHEGIRELGLQVNDKAVDVLYRRLREHTGERLPADNPGDLYNVLLWATTTRRYQDGQPGPQGDREEIIRKIDSDFREFGRTQLLANDTELRQKYMVGQALQELQQTPVSQRDRMRGRQERTMERQERTMERQEQRLRVGAPQ
jgi:hypothetical protein